MLKILYFENSHISSVRKRKLIRDYTNFLEHLLKVFCLIILFAFFRDAYWKKKKKDLLSKVNKLKYLAFVLVNSYNWRLKE